MSQPFIGEIRMVGFNFDPEYWELCNGQSVSSRDFPELFALIGTTYGGDGNPNFSLPDLRGRVPMHRSSSHYQGLSWGMEAIGLIRQNLPEHGHLLNASGSGAAEDNPEGHAFADIQEAQAYKHQAPLQPMSYNSVSATGGDEMHYNMQPFQTINFIIATRGLWPQRP